MREELEKLCENMYFATRAFDVGLDHSDYLRGRIDQLAKCHEMIATILANDELENQK